MWHKEILSEAQVGLLPTVMRFRDHFGLVGGTAVALYVGPRESIDFDLFPKDPKAPFSPRLLKNRFERGALLGKTLVQSESEITFYTKSKVKVTFYNFQYNLPFTTPLDSVIDMPDLLTLAAMKAFAIGQRAKWKDYVDLYFLIRDHHSVHEISAQAKDLFGGDFNALLFREQLAYFGRMRYDEPVIFRPGFEVPEDEIKRAFQRYSTD